MIEPATIMALNATYERIGQRDNSADHSFFMETLLACNSIEYLDYHYGLIVRSDCHSALFELICRGFHKRGNAGERYLLDRLKVETDARISATVLQILGGFRYANGTHIHETAQFARSHLSSSDSVLRLRSIWVLGWTGTPADIEPLAQTLRSDSDPRNRSSAAAAMMQLFMNDSTVAKHALIRLEAAMWSERNDWTLEHILIAIQEISGCAFGLNPATRTPASRRLLESAKAMAEAYFASKHTAVAHASPQNQESR